MGFSLKFANQYNRIILFYRVTLFNIFQNACRGRIRAFRFDKPGWMNPFPASEHYKIKEDLHMDNGKRRMPLENHRTAAWINTKTEKSKSRVSIPREEGVFHAKEHVDENEK